MFEQTELTKLLLISLKESIRSMAISNSYARDYDPEFNELYLKFVELKKRIEKENLDVRLVSREY